MEGTYPEQEILSLDHPLHVEQEQRICSVDGLKTNMVASIFPAVEQQVYFQEFFPEPGNIPTQ